MATETPKKSESTEHNVTHKPVEHTAVAAPDIPKGPRSYLVMMLLAVLALPSGLARAYRGEQIGWTRFWIYVGATVACIIPFLNILGLVAILALLVWGAIDVFQLRKVKTDADGGALLTTERDEKFAKGFFIYFIVSLCLAAAFALFMLVFGAFIFSGIMNNVNNNRGTDYTSPYDSYNSRDFLRDFESQSR